MICTVKLPRSMLLYLFRSCMLHTKVNYICQKGQDTWKCYGAFRNRNGKYPLITNRALDKFGCFHAFNINTKGIQAINIIMDEPSGDSAWSPQPMPAVLFAKL